MPPVATLPAAALGGLVEAIPVPIVIATPSFAVVDLNAAAGRALSTRPQAARGLPLSLLVGREFALRDGWLCCDGSELLELAGRDDRRTWRFACEPLEGDGAGALLVLTGIDVTEQEATRRSRRELERQLRALVANVPAVLWAVDAEGRLSLLEGRGLESFGTDGRGLVGRAAAATFREHADILAYLARGMAGESFSALFEVRGRQLDGWFEPIRDEQGRVVGVAGVATDVTERRRQEVAIAQSQKMESLGVMAGTVAHDFNNLLTAILGFAGLLKLSPSLDPRDREQLYRIEQAARRGADIAGRLLSFSRGGLARFVEVDLCEIARETADLARPALPQGAQLELRLAPGAVVVEGDPVQLQQAVLNVVLNARDAISAAGRISLEVRVAGGEGCVVVSDDGQGMDEATRARIFEPFFTTKHAGAGTGLGLAITYGVVRGHGGRIELETEPGAGTRFELHFPLAEGRAGLAGGSDPGEGNLILLVDDDELVRRSMSESLSHLGYNVVEVANGALAVELVRARPGRFAAMLLDLVMPGMTGREVFEAVSEVRPDLPVILCTGYAPEAHIDERMKRSIAALLQKPFTPDRLAETLAQVGARPGSA